MSRDSKFVILDASEASSIDYALVQITSADTLPWNNDRSKCYVKYTGSKPSFLHGKDTLTHSQMLAELREEDSGWRPDPPEE